MYDFDALASMLAHGSRETRQSPLATSIANQRLMRECRGGELFDLTETKGYIADPVAVHVQMICEAIFFVDECDNSASRSSTSAWPRC